MSDNKPHLPEDFWSEHREAELAGWLQATPQQRLNWLEDALRLVHARGTLLRKPRPDDGEW